MDDVHQTKNISIVLL